MIPDLECTAFPDVWFGVSITPCCAAHDVSPLDTASSLDLGVCVFQTLSGSHPIAASIIAGVMVLGTAIWCGLRYGLRGISERRKP
ncbi:hypothetical protein [Aurantimonas coralicida]|uniref:hypothetical protein n=1 Tax=Aurantimonas coralicida TaxID=182270 RepID=UPI001E568325|nr:hypothetical protein [Aurantimonas coralicida]MCD1644162.1 hypothetical protein [Aurantimonas coralicida]